MCEANSDSLANYWGFPVYFLFYFGRSPTFLSGLNAVLTLFLS